MEYVMRGLKFVGAAVAGALSYLFGGWDIWLGAMTMFVVLDVITGLLAGFLNKSKKTESGGLSSSVMFAGSLKKLVMYLVVALGVMVDRLIGPGSTVIRSLVIGYYVVNEGLSVLENVGSCGVPFPQKLKDALEKLKS